LHSTERNRGWEAGKCFGAMEERERGNQQSAFRRKPLTIKAGGRQTPLPPHSGARQREAAHSGCFQTSINHRFEPWTM